MLPTWWSWCYTGRQRTFAVHIDWSPPATVAHGNYKRCWAPETQVRRIGQVADVRCAVALKNITLFLLPFFLNPIMNIENLYIFHNCNGYHWSRNPLCLVSFKGFPIVDGNEPFVPLSDGIIQVHSIVHLSHFLFFHQNLFFVLENW